MGTGLTLTPWELGLIQPSAQRVNINPLGTGFINPVRKGLTLTPWVLWVPTALWVPSAKRVNIKPLGTGFNLTQCAKG